MDHKSQLSVLILFGMIVVTFLLLLNRDDVSGSGIIAKLKKLLGIGTKPVGPGGPKPTGTVVFDDTPRLVLEQLDKKTGEVIHRYPIPTFQVKNEYGKFSDVPDQRETRGYYVSRPNADHGDIFLDGRCQDAFSVSEEHLFIGEENGILYVRDNGSRHGTFINRTRKRIDGMDIENGLVLILGKQAIRFIIPQTPEMEWFDEAGFTNVEEDYRPETKKKAPRIMRRIVK